MPKSAAIFFLLGVFINLGKPQAHNEDYDEYVPVNGQKFDIFDWQLCTTIAAKDPGNVLISPISIKILMAMLYEGSTGSTAKELATVLNFPKSRSSSRLQTTAILRSLQARNGDYELDVGSKIYIDQTLTPKNWFQRVLYLYYNAYIEKLNFTDYQSAANRINYWVDTVTHGHIKTLVSQAEALDQTVFLLINAIYFKGRWQHQFAEQDTFLGDFKSPQGLTKVKYLKQTNNFYYLRSESMNAQILRLPYMGQKFAMYIVLPEKEDGLDQLAATINPFALRKEIWMLEEISVTVILPKFKFDYKANLKETLQKMGLKTIFESFGDMKGLINNNKIKNLAVSNVIQKTAIEVNEEGSVAAAVSEMQFINKFGGFDELFNASHPFLFFIEDESTGTVVFVGKFVNPETESLNEALPSARFDESMYY